MAPTTDRHYWQDGPFYLATGVLVEKKDGTICAKDVELLLDSVENRFKIKGLKYWPTLPEYVKRRSKDGN